MLKNYPCKNTNITLTMRVNLPFNLNKPYNKYWLKTTTEKFALSSGQNKISTFFKFSGRGRSTEK